MTGANRVLVERCGVIGFERARMQTRKVIGAARQLLLQVLERNVEVAAEMGLHRQAIVEKRGDIHLETASKRLHGVGAAAANLRSRRDATVPCLNASRW